MSTHCEAPISNAWDSHCYTYLRGGKATYTRGTQFVWVSTWKNRYSGGCLLDLCGTCRALLRSRRGRRFPQSGQPSTVTSLPCSDCQQRRSSSIATNARWVSEGAGYHAWTGRWADSWPSGIVKLLRCGSSTKEIDNIVAPGDCNFIR